MLIIGMKQSKLLFFMCVIGIIVEIFDNLIKKTAFTKKLNYFFYFFVLLTPLENMIINEKI